MARRGRAGGASPPGKRPQRRHIAAPAHPAGVVRKSDSALVRLPDSAAIWLHSLTSIGLPDNVTTPILIEFGPYFAPNFCACAHARSASASNPSALFFAWADVAVPRITRPLMPWMMPASRNML